jgi:hypothetical protein
MNVFLNAVCASARVKSDEMAEGNAPADPSVIVENHGLDQEEEALYPPGVLGARTTGAQRSLGAVHVPAPSPGWIIIRTDRKYMASFPVANTSRSSIVCLPNRVSRLACPRSMTVCK